MKANLGPISSPITKKTTCWLMSLVFLAVVGCRDPFEPNLSDHNPNYLVVEGFVETNGMESKINLSRTLPIPVAGEFAQESGASIRLRGASGELWQFQEESPGEYILQEVLDNNLSYTLEINLTDGNRYISKELHPIVSPEIDELGYIRDHLGVDVYISTKGNEQAQYFLWEYEEHWIFRPAVWSVLKFEDDVVKRRGDHERIDLCWKANLFPKIVLQNAARFQDNTILQRELVRIPNLSEKLMARYSIQVRQRAIDQEAFDFWEIMRKNSDDIGGIFSPLPSFLRSNLMPIDDSDTPVIGHISMGESSSRRIYINHVEVEPWTVVIPEYDNCAVIQDTIPVPLAPTRFRSGSIVPAREIYNNMGGLIGYLGAKVECTDCTLRGSNQAPDFWED